MPPKNVADTLQPYVDSHTLAGAVVLWADKDRVLGLETGRVEWRRDRFRSMASCVSALSSIVANGHQVVPTFPPPPLFIPYGEFSPVKCGAPHLMREIRPSGSEGGVALITPSLPLSRCRTWLTDTSNRTPGQSGG